MSQAELVAQAGLTGEEEGKAVLAVPVEVGQEGQQGEQIGPQVMGFVHHEQNGEMAFLDETDDLLLDAPEAEGAGPVRLQAELEGELTEEVGGIDGGVVEVDGPDLFGVEGVAQAAQGRGLARAGLAREKAETPRLHEVFQARVQLVEGRGAEELVGREVPVEGDAVEAEEGGVHQPSPSSLP